MFPGILQFWDLVWIFLIVFVSVVTVSFWTRAGERRRLSNLEIKMDRLLAQERSVEDRLPPEPAAANVPAGVLDALQRGNKIEAIKRYRAVTGVGLAEAKVFVDRLEAGKTA